MQFFYKFFTYFAGRLAEIYKNKLSLVA